MTIYSCIYGEIQTDEVIVTKRQTRHSDLHNDVYQKYGQYFSKVLQEPDYIFEDSRNEEHPNTGIGTKRIEEADGVVLQIVLRIKTSRDPEGYQNSIITSWVIGEKRLQAYLRNRKLLYIWQGL